MALTKEAILARGKVKEVELPGGDTVFIKELPSSFFISPNKGGKKAEDKDTGGAAQIASSLCDAGGTLMFDPAKETDAVLAIPLGDFKHLIQEIMVLNGLEPAATQDGAAPTEAEKN